MKTKATKKKPRTVEPVPPIDITVRIWLDRDPEVVAHGVAPWLVQSALYTVLELPVETGEDDA